MKTIHVVAAVIIKNGKVFATQRGYGDYKGKWEFPGGKIEPEETAQEALIREIREELETEIEAKEHLCTVEYDYPEFHLNMQCYLCRIVSGDLVLREHEAAKWLRPSELWSVNWLPADVKVVQRLEDRIIGFEDGSC